jgi:hypothetical protein
VGNIVMRGRRERYRRSHNYENMPLFWLRRRK